ncbi:MAG: carbohydrate ABC transporter permease [Caldilineaceae bacterium]|nr:carbohydrate ABC transporter permease [Caldilineaceae bacterium]
MARGRIAPLNQVLLYLLLVATGLAVGVPFVIMVLTSFKLPADIITFPPRFLPTAWTFSNYQLIWTRLPFAMLIRNSLVYSFTITIISLFFDSMCAYALARLHFRWRNVVFIAILATMMIPAQVTLVPLFFNLFALGWINTFQGLIVPHLTSAFGIFLLRQFFISIPRDFEDAARIDGAGEFRIYWQIILPLSGPALATLFVFHFMYNWNDFLWPLIVTTTADMRTLPTGLALFMGEHNIEYGVLLSGATIAALPLVLAFLFAQRYFVAGIALTGIKE